MSHAVSFTSRDRSKACAMLARFSDPFGEGQKDQIGRMLRTMLMLGLKMEIQGFEKINGGIQDWLETKIVD